MKGLFHTALSILMTVVLSGCIQDTIVVHVKPNGSGTIDETSLLSNSMFDVMESVAGSMTGPSKEGGSQEEAKQTRDDVIARMVKVAEKRADTFGAKVKFISAKPVKTDTGSGYNAVYAFQDINEVMINQNPGTRMDGEKTQRSDSLRDEYILFKFIEGLSSKLIVTLPAQRETASDKSSAQDSGKAVQGRLNKETSAQAPEMMKNFFQDLKIKISLQFEGTIINTNATYRDGSTVILIEMDIGKIISNGELFKRMLAINLQSVGETKALYKNIEGLKFETNNPVTVEFR
ncbi:MAG: hypothetical protein ACXU9J_10555 [Syntrophales bacterium]